MTNFNYYPRPEGCLSELSYPIETDDYGSYFELLNLKPKKRRYICTAASVVPFEPLDGGVDTNALP